MKQGENTKERKDVIAFFVKYAKLKQVTLGESFREGTKT